MGVMDKHISYDINRGTPNHAFHAPLLQLMPCNYCVNSGTLSITDLKIKNASLIGTLPIVPAT